ncbi:hypothetical protein [Klebsiella quasipneumoniae]|uniref:hypothetical protein n=1 Tax=Klebsiella quasipneumoniae TaxID=1463165 RepID=UPI0034D21CA9
MTKSTITRERLEELAAGQSGFNLRTATHEESQELALIALAAMGSKPVFFIEVEGDDWINAGRIEGKNRQDLGLLPDGINYLYAAPQPLTDAEREELQELRRSYLALRGENEDLQAQLYEAESQADDAAEELQERRKADSEPVAYMYDGEDGREYNGHNEFSGGGKGIPLYRHAQPAPGCPEVLPCPVLLEPGFRFGKGIKTSTVLSALARRAVYESDMAALSPEEKAEFREKIADFKALIAQPAPVVTFYRDGIEAAAKWIDQQREAYDSEHGRYDTGTGFFEFGNDAQREYSSTLEELAEGIRALHPNAGNSPAIPDGYVMVPREPTEAMYEAGDQQLATKQVWDAMLAAAPQEVKGE